MTTEDKLAHDGHFRTLQMLDFYATPVEQVMCFTLYFAEIDRRHQNLCEGLAALAATNYLGVALPGDTAPQ
jgi:hypothetical protein